MPHGGPVKAPLLWTPDTPHQYCTEGFEGGSELGLHIIQRKEEIKKKPDERNSSISTGIFETNFVPNMTRSLWVIVNRVNLHFSKLFLSKCLLTCLFFSMQNFDKITWTKNRFLLLVKLWRYTILFSILVLFQSKLECHLVLKQIQIVATIV